MYLQVSSIHIETSYALNGRGSILGKGKNFISTPQRPDQLWGPTSPKSVPGALPHELKRPGRKADHSPAEIRNNGAIPTSSWRGT
jgi:hypothetical protein